ncbi:PIN domain-containing protein [Candidatus Collierbacteria bacterium]|nr:PIN domain-containing protein [Candidatus Collierbacteria bacterium]
MENYQLDTNALLRYLAHDIPSKYQKVRYLFNKAKNGQVTLNICEPVFIETAVMLKQYFKFPKDKVVDFLHDLLNASYLNIENSSRLAPAIDIYSQNSIDLVDAIVLVRAYINNQQIFTFDSKLSLLASSREKAN